jgi:hypothetical protein
MIEKFMYAGRNVAEKIKNEVLVFCNEILKLLKNLVSCFTYLDVQYDYRTSIHERKQESELFCKNICEVLMTVWKNLMLASNWNRAIINYSTFISPWWKGMLVELGYLFEQEVCLLCWKKFYDSGAH